MLVLLSPSCSYGQCLNVLVVIYLHMSMCHEPPLGKNLYVAVLHKQPHWNGPDHVPINGTSMPSAMHRIHVEELSSFDDVTCTCTQWSQVHLFIIVLLFTIASVYMCSP